MANLLQQYENSFSEINWNAKTREEQIDFTLKWIGLKIFDAKLNKANGQIHLENQEKLEKQWKQAYIESLKSIGYLCDNKIDDYYKLFNHPEIFGDNWKEKAELFHSESVSIDDFINLTKQYLWEQ